MSKPEIRSLEVLIGKLNGAGGAHTRDLVKDDSKRRLERGPTDKTYADLLRVYHNKHSYEHFHVDPNVTDHAHSLGLIELLSGGKARPSNGKPVYVINALKAAGANAPDVNRAAGLTTLAQYTLMTHFAKYTYLHNNYNRFTFRTERVGGQWASPPINANSVNSLMSNHMIDIDTDFRRSDGGLPDFYPSSGFLYKITNRGIASFNDYATKHGLKRFEACIVDGMAELEAERQRAKQAEKVSLNGAIIHYNAEPEWRLVFWLDDGVLTVTQPLSMPTVIISDEAIIVAELWKKAAAILDDEGQIEAVLEAIRLNQRRVITKTVVVGTDPAFEDEDEL